MKPVKNYPVDAVGGFTLIELVAAMMAASLLVAGLAMAMLITNQSLEDAIAPSDRTSTIRMVADRIAEEANQATTIRLNGSTIELTLPDRDGDGQDEQVTYSSSGSGLVRSQSLHPPVSFLSIGPALTLRGENSISAPEVALPEPIRLLAMTQTATTARTWSHSIMLPRATRAGDLQMLVTLADDNYVGPFAGGWNLVTQHRDNGLHVSLFARTATNTELENVNVYLYALGTTNMAVAALNFTGIALSMVGDHVSTSSGAANPATGTGMPVAITVTETPAVAMNLQVLAVQGRPLANATAGLAGYADATMATAMDNSNSLFTLAVAIRNGRPTTAGPAVFAINGPSAWTQVAAQWWP